MVLLRLFVHVQVEVLVYLILVLVRLELQSHLQQFLRRVWQLTQKVFAELLFDMGVVELLRQACPVRDSVQLHTHNRVVDLAHFATDIQVLFQKKRGVVSRSMIKDHLDNR